MKRWLAACVALCLAGAALGEDAKWRPDGSNVLVIYVTDDADTDRDGTPDSQQIAQYYAQRRNVPQENLLGLTPNRASLAGSPASGSTASSSPGGNPGSWDYRLFYDQCLKAVYDKLHSKASDGKAFSERICYIVICPGVPMDLLTHHVAPGKESAKDSAWWLAKTSCRALDSFLISPDANYRIGCDLATHAPGATASGLPLGSVESELTLPFFEAFAGPAKGTHFRQRRHDNRGEYDFYLVTRLGLDLQTARDMLDGALYVERFLRLSGAAEVSGFRPAIWLDQKRDFASDHVAAMTHCVVMAQGGPGSMFAVQKGLHAPWPTVIDNQSAEIGKMIDGVRHKPTVAGRIASEGVDAEGVTLAPPANGDVPGVLYFPKGCTISAYATPSGAAATQPAEIFKGQPKASALVIGMDVERNKLLLDNVRGFAVGDTVAYIWPGQFPADDCFFFYGFYDLNQYEDVFKFPPGAMGIHVDSACMKWAKSAMRRGIAGTYGVIGEPLSAGIPYGDQMLSALSQGYDWAEANYGALKLAQRRVGVVFGDPLYAPFRSQQALNETRPVVGPVKLTAGEDGIIVSAVLAGQSPDELAEVALFRLDYGPGTAYGQVVNFFDWPESAEPAGTASSEDKDGAGAQESQAKETRRFGYSRFFQATLKDLPKGEPVHFRLTVRDPLGHESSTDDAVFVP